MATPAVATPYIGEGLDTFLPAVADYSASANQFLGITEDANGKANVNSGAGGAIVGVMINKPKLGEAAFIRHYGESKVKLSGTVAAGNAIKCAADGSFLLATTGSTIVGYMKEDGVSGDLRVAFISAFSRLLAP
jgi:hypothetical protein